MERIWKDIDGTNGMYQISNYGEVKSFTKFKNGDLLKPSNFSNGYLFVHIKRNGQRRSNLVHRLVAEAFIPNPERFPQVNHKDENKKNNRADNLEWCDNRYNNIYGTKNQRASEKNKISHCIPVVCIELNKTFKSAKEAARFVNKSGTNITRACKNIYRTCGGYHWEYA